MTREELITKIKKLGEMSVDDQISSYVVYRWLEDIRDNGITEPTRYTVQVIPDDATGYLSRDGDGTIYFGENTELMNNHPSFTQSEIDEFKHRDDLAIDWNKVKIEPVEESK